MQGLLQGRAWLQPAAQGVLLLQQEQQVYATRWLRGTGIGQCLAACSAAAPGEKRGRQGMGRAHQQLHYGHGQQQLLHAEAAR